MTTTQHVQLPTTHRMNARRIVESLPKAALAIVLFALLSGAWLAFFTFLPLDFTPPRVG